MFTPDVLPDASPSPYRGRCEGGPGHLCLHGNQMHQRRVHERPRPGSQRLPRRDHRPALAHQVPLHPAGVLPQVSGRRELFFRPPLVFSPAVLSLPCPDRSKEDQQKSIFVPCDKGGYRLKDNVQFHLYISTSPCGDARIFSPHEASIEGTECFF